MLPQESLEVVRQDGPGLDCRVQAARAIGCLTDVPERYPGRHELIGSVSIRNVRRKVEELSDDSPETVLRMRVVLAGLQRRLTGKRPQHQDLGAVIGNWHETSRWHGDSCES